MEKERRNMFVGVPERHSHENELINIIKSNSSDSVIRNKLSDYHDNDIANVLDMLTSDERRRLYKILGDDKVSDIFAYLGEDAEKFINELGPEKAADIIEAMDADDAVDILGELEDDKSGKIKSLMDTKARKDIDLILSYENDEIGSKMTTNFIAIKRGYTIKQSMKALVDQAADNDNISTLYVINDDGTFYGAVGLKELIVARNYMDLESLVVTSYPYVYAEEKTKECIEELTDYSEDSIPVLDNGNRLIGVITAQDITEAMDEEFGDDYAKLGGLTSEEDINEPFVMSVKKRMPWLILLLFLGLFVSSVVGMFESVVSQITLVVCFQSLILDMAGNVGTQSLAVTIRVLMDEKISGMGQLKLILKEMKVGLANGLLLGVMSFVLVGAYIFFAKAKGAVFAFAVSGCIGVSLVTAMVISSFVGTAVPIFFKKINVDPAVASGPLITTINDLVAVVAYYGIVWALLINTLSLVE